MGFNVQDQMGKIQSEVNESYVEELRSLGAENKGNDRFFRAATRVALSEDILDQLVECEHTKSVAHYRPLEGRLPFVKKVIRKMTAFVVGPVVDDQNRNNDASFALDETMVRVISQQQIAIDALERRVAELEDEVAREKKA